MTSLFAAHSFDTHDDQHWIQRMKFLKPTPVLRRDIQLTDKMERALKRIARDLNVSFESNPHFGCCFKVEGKRGPASVEKKRALIVQTLMEVGVGDERGPFTGHLWYAAQIEFHGIAVDDFRRSMSGKTVCRN